MVKLRDHCSLLIFLFNIRIVVLICSHVFRRFAYAAPIWIRFLGNASKNPADMRKVLKMRF